MSIFSITNKTNLNLPNFILFLWQGSRKSEEENLLAENDRMLDNLAGKVSRLKSVCELKLKTFCCYQLFYLVMVKSTLFRLLLI